MLSFRSQASDATHPPMLSFRSLAAAAAAAAPGPQHDHDVQQDRIVMEEQEQEDDEEDVDVFLGSSEVRIVGIRYYRGVAHPGEFVQLVREPHNEYDSNAIRVDTVGQNPQKIGHIKRESAAMLAPLMDRWSPQIRLEGLIPRQGNTFNLPLLLEFYSTKQDKAPELAQILKNSMRCAVHMAPDFGGTTASTSANPSRMSATPSIGVRREKIDWCRQQEELDSMFDQQLQRQLQNLPDLDMPNFCNLQLFDFQVQGIRFLVQKETNPQPPPFFTTVKEQGRTMHLCEITQSSQPHPPSPIRGSILCDAMGLGKSIQTLGLILLAPREKAGSSTSTDPTRSSSNGSCVEQQMKGNGSSVEQQLRGATVATLKQILKNAKLKSSGTKNVLMDRILDHLAQNPTFQPFPDAPSAQMKIQPTGAIAKSTQKVKKCTLVVCPVSVMANWTQQVQDHVPEGKLILQVYHGHNRQEILEQKVQQEDSVDILLVSYHTLAAEYSATFGSTDLQPKEHQQAPMCKKRKRETIFDVHFHRIVLDEAVRMFVFIALSLVLVD
eukprot:scaffold8235_cov113-Cylindrotheca_fusiformis.AAC.6